MKHAIQLSCHASRGIKKREGPYFFFPHSFKKKYSVFFSLSLSLLSAVNLMRLQGHVRRALISTTTHEAHSHEKPSSKKKRDKKNESIQTNRLSLPFFSLLLWAPLLPPGAYKVCCYYTRERHS